MRKIAYEVPTEAKRSCEVFGHLPEPVFDQFDCAIEIRCGRCKRPLHDPV